jgi:hypothetical protein
MAGPVADGEDFVPTGSLTIERGIEGWRWRRDDLESVTALGYVDAVRAELLDDVKDAREHDG